jgi:hypothetical protein
LADIDAGLIAQLSASLMGLSIRKMPKVIPRLKEGSLSHRISAIVVICGVSVHMLPIHGDRIHQKSVRATPT